MGLRNGNEYASPSTSINPNDNNVLNFYIEKMRYFDKPKKINVFTIKLIYLKLSNLGRNLLTFQDSNTVNAILGYLYIQCIMQQSTKPIDEYVRSVHF